MRIDILTLFPGMFAGPMDESIVGRARQQGLLQLELHNIRDWAADRHHTVDDTPYGGGAGMVMKADVLGRAITAVQGMAAHAPVLLLSPQGRLLNQALAKELAGEPRLLLVCGHYEGIDERAILRHVDEEISIGDYVLTGGEIPAMVLVDTVARLIPSVLDEESLRLESHHAGLLEHPQYTRPADYDGLGIPPILLSGHHAEIERYHRQESLRRTLQRRPDLLSRAPLTAEDRAFLRTLQWPPDPMRLLIASNNRGKLREYRDILGDLPLDLVSPADLGIRLDIAETGDTYEENALLKAQAFAQASGLLTLADDSGLEVDALGGGPGVHSHRYAGGGDADRYRALLEQLQGVPPEERTARFRCVIALVTPEGASYRCEGICPGVIIDEPRGTGGFGYDPVFLLPETAKTMAELTPAEKNRLSHRGRAGQYARPILMGLLPAGRPEVGRAVHGEVVVEAGIADVWAAWTTPAGVRSFFSPECYIDLRVGGAYEMYFDLEAAPGLRGGEGMSILALQPPTMLSFTWNAPPELPAVRGQRTSVVVRLEKVDDEHTRVLLAHSGWGSGSEWDTAFAYFERAWKQVVLPRLQRRFAGGPVDWGSL